MTRTRADFERAADLVVKGDIAKRSFDAARAAKEVAQADYDKAKSALIQAQAAKVQAEAELAGAKADLGAPGEENARIRAAKAALETARLNLEFAQVRASVDGYVTNLGLRPGSQAVANQPVLALVDVNSFWVHGFFRENHVGGINAGDRAIVTLMSFPDKPVEGRVVSRGWGVFQKDGATAQELLDSDRGDR